MKQPKCQKVIDKTQKNGIDQIIGNTPIIEFKSLNQATGCRILLKCEHLNPGNSLKDRTALWIINQAENSGLLKQGATLIEASGGNTG